MSTYQELLTNEYAIQYAINCFEDDKICVLQDEGVLFRTQLIRGLEGIEFYENR